VTPTPEFDGPRLIQPEEWRASHALSEICFGGPDNAAPPEEAGRQASPPGETYVICAAGVPVSQISIFFTPIRVYDSLLKIGSIGGVCTHPDYRGYGLASRLMEHCTRLLVEGGAHLMVISGGRGLYTRLGNVPMGRFANFALRPGQARPPVPLVVLRPARPADAAFCSRIYQAEAVHFTRSIPRFAGRFRPHEIGFHAEDYIIEMGDQPAAYLLLSVPWDSMEFPGLPVRCIDEYAGSRLAVSAGLAAAVETLQLQELHAPIPWQDTDLIHLLSDITAAPSGFTSLPDHTQRIINFPALMRALQPILAARLKPSLRRGLRFEQSGPLLGSSGSDRYTIVRGSDRLELDGAAMTRLVMGSPSEDPAPAAPGALAEIIASAFPLPAFFVGLDYH